MPRNLDLSFHLNDKAAEELAGLIDRLTDPLDRQGDLQAYVSDIHLTNPNFETRDNDYLGDVGRNIQTMAGYIGVKGRHRAMLSNMKELLEHRTEGYVELKTQLEGDAQLPQPRKQALLETLAILEDTFTLLHDFCEKELANEANQQKDSHVAMYLSAKDSRQQAPHDGMQL